MGFIDKLRKRRTSPWGVYKVTCLLFL